jgi:hypothetical protein
MCDNQGVIRMKREQFIQHLRKLARQKNVRFEVMTIEGKGSHYRIVFGGKSTILKSGELNPGYIRLVKKQLEIE